MLRWFTFLTAVLLVIFPVLVWAADYDLSSPANYDARIDGAAASDLLTYQGALVSGDVNGDGIDDLVVGTAAADINGADSGSVWVIFGGTTLSGNKPLSTSSNYNIRYDGSAAGDQLGRYKQIAIGDVNGDGLGDLILGSSTAESSKGAAYVIFSTLIDDVGATTGNVKSLATSSNYNIKYVGAATNGYLTNFGEMAVADVNGDGLNDLILGANSEDNNGADSGSVYIMFSTLIDDVGATTGNDKPMTTSSNYNIRYDGSAASEFLGGNYVGGRFGTGDINGDSFGDLVIGTSTNKAYVMFSTLIDDVGATTGNDKPLSTSTNYNIRYDGTASGGNLTNEGAIGVGDVNGDGLDDLVLGSDLADLNGTNSGAAWVMFSTLIDDVGATTGNNLGLDTGTSYNIRYVAYGSATSSVQSKLTENGTILIGDVNDDSLGDLVLGAPSGSRCAGGTSQHGNAYVLFSTLIDDVGATTGNNKLLTTTTNYNICYAGPHGSAFLTDDRAMAVGDVNGDSKEDLILGSYQMNIVTTDGGAAYVFYSTLIDDVGATTGNDQLLSNSTYYSDRYNGGAAGDFLTIYGTVLISDLNDDGVTDLVLGARGVDSNGADAGSVYLFYATAPNSNPNDPTSLGGHVSGNYTNDTTPTLTFTLSDPDGSDTVKYQIQVDDTSNFSSPAVDYTSALDAQGAASFTVGQAAGAGSYTAGSEGQTLSDGDYYWRVKAIDENAAESGYSTANGGAAAFIVDATDPTDPTGLDSTSHTISTWSADPTVDLIWLAGTDAGSGLDGYSILWDTSSGTVPDTAKELEEGATSTTSDPLADGDSHWFHLRTADNAGNWTSTIQIGPFWIDGTPPTDPGTPATTSPTTDTTPTWSWTASVDAASGLRAAETYQVQWSQSSNFSSGVSSAFTTTNSYTHSTALSLGTWYFRVRVYDEADNASGLSANGSVLIEASEGEPSPEPAPEPEPEPEPEPIYGCTDPSATNYNLDAEFDDGSCQYPVPGCTDPNASNYSSDATADDGSCQYLPPSPPPTFVEAVIEAVKSTAVFVVNLVGNIVKLVAKFILDFFR